MANAAGSNNLAKMFRLIKDNWNILHILRTVYRMDMYKVGKLVGEDKYGNKYYENNSYFYSSNRWVVYNENVGLNYDGSQVPAEWFGWLHYKTDYLPHEDPGRPKYKWMADHKQNMSGTTEAYMPYNTTKPKIQPWKPPQ